MAMFVNSWPTTITKQRAAIGMKNLEVLRQGFRNTCTKFQHAVFFLFFSFFFWYFSLLPLCCIEILLHKTVNNCAETFRWRLYLEFLKVLKQNWLHVVSFLFYFSTFHIFLFFFLFEKKITLLFTFQLG